jgi:hypothetical protein
MEHHNHSNTRNKRRQEESAHQEHRNKKQKPFGTYAGVQDGAKSCTPGVPRLLQYEYCICRPLHALASYCNDTNGI